MYEPIHFFTQNGPEHLFAFLLELRSAESAEHLARVSRYTRILLRQVQLQCPEYGLTDTAVTLISRAASLHDIGKLAIPDAILLKPGPLTSRERSVMQKHTLAGCHILRHIGSDGASRYLNYARDICLYHHERWDGGGYPEKLRGDAIPIWAQAVGLTDAYDALTSSRVYKSAYSREEAKQMILDGRCGAFSPRLLDCFLHSLADFHTGIPSDNPPCSYRPVN